MQEKHLAARRFEGQDVTDVQWDSPLRSDNAMFCWSRRIDKIIISGYISGNVLGGLTLVKAQRTAMNNFRKRLQRQGMARLEVHVRKDDATLVRNVVRALSSPEQEQAARALLREHFGSGQAEGLKALLAAAPLEGIDLSRVRDLGRDVDL
jgi:hypothetical protein